MRYIGKERDEESLLADHGVRKYDYDLARFTCPDPMWEKYYSWTPYQYAGCNPVSMMDDNGKWVKEVSKESHIHSGTVSRNNNGYLANKINYEFYDNWKQNAPKIASFVEQKSFFVIQSKLDPNVYGQAIRGGNEMKIDLNKEKSYEKLEGAALHEIVHLMGFGEFGAYGANLANGNISVDDMVKMIDNDMELQDKIIHGNGEQLWSDWLDGKISTKEIVKNMLQEGQKILRDK
jgi:RHS repeat-associated protein